MRKAAIENLHRAQNGDLDSSSSDDDDEEEDAAELERMAEAGFQFRVESTGARVTLSSSKDLLFQICAKLPTDKYARVSACFLIRCFWKVFVRRLCLELFCRAKSGRTEFYAAKLNHQGISGLNSPGM